MRRLSITGVTPAGFKSFTSSTPIVLSTQPGLKYIGGENQVDPRLGANGAGKSSIFDAIYWCFYGTSLRGARTSQLIAADKCSVQVDLDIDGELYQVWREGSPDRIAIDGELVEQSAVNQLLGCSREQFRQSVIYGQMVPLFYDLSVPARGELFDQVMDTGLWMELSDDAGKRIRTAEQQLAHAQQELARAQGRREALSNEDNLRQAEREWQATHEERVEAALKALSDAEAAKAAAASALRNARRKATAAPNAEETKRLIDETRAAIRKAQSDDGAYAYKIEQANKAIEFYNNNTTCPTCQQPISDQTAHTCITTSNRLLNHHKQQRRELQKQLSEYQQLEERHLNDMRDMYNARGEISRLQEVANNLSREDDRLAKAAEQLIQATNPYVDMLNKLLADIEAADLQVQQHQTIVAAHEADVLKLQFWQQGFRKVRLFLIGRVLAALELEATAAAASIGLAGWQITCRTEHENKSGGVRHGIHIQVIAAGDARMREWSPGELQRVRIAVAIGFANLIQRAAGIEWSLECWDEPSNWLSSEGIEDLLYALRNRATVYNKSIWVIDHRSLAHVGFDETWQVTKTISGSRVELVGG